MDVKDVRRLFKDAEWRSKPEIEAFIQEAGQQPAAELSKLLGLLVDRTLVADNTRHRNRCFAFLKLAEGCKDHALFVPYAKALKTADQALRTVLTALIPRVNNVTAHPELCDALQSPDEAVRQTAAKILGDIAGAQAFKAIEALCAKRDFPGRMEAMAAIVPKAGHRAVPMLREIVAHGKLHEKTRALTYLGDSAVMGKDLEAASLALADALNDSDERIVCGALVALGGVCAENRFLEYIEQFRDTQSLPLVRAITDAMKHYQSSAAIDWLGRKLRLGPNSIRLAAIASLESIGSDEVVPLLVDTLKHPQLIVRNRAGEALGALAMQHKVDLARTIIWLLRNRDVNVRRMAVELARKVGDPTGELTPKLLRFLRDEDWWVRERVADALVEMAGQNLTRHVVDYLQDESDVVRRYAVGFLKRLKDPRSLGALVRTAQSDTDWWVREWAIEAMSELGDARAVPYLVDILQRDSEVRIPCLIAIGKFGAEQHVPLIARFLSHADAETRIEAIRTLMKAPGPETVRHLEPLVNDPEHRVVTAAVAALKTLNETRVGAAATERATNLLDRMLLAMSQREADDLILAADRKPYIKKHGRTSTLLDQAFTGDEIHALLIPHLTAIQQKDLSLLRDIDFSHEVKAAGLRFRAHVFNSRTGPSAVFRIVKQDIRSLETLGAPKIVETFGKFKNGLVLVGGPTGSGKSSTLAAIIDYINRIESNHIVTLEDPIEVVHQRKISLINQREIGTHTHSFGHALRATLRQDPDVILVGEMRDLETIQFAVTAAETGHLVFGTVHTVSADTSVDRLINAFPPGQQPQVRVMLAETLRAVACQHLVRRKDGGRILCAEILLNTEAVSSLIRKGKTYQIPSVVATSREAGMQSMDVELARLVNENIITVEEGYAKANDKRAFENMTGMSPADKDKAAPQAKAG